MRNALITGVTGQDGSYLAELLLKKDYNVFGLVRRQSSPDKLTNIEHLLEDNNFTLIDGDLTDQSSLINAIEISDPDEVYNLAAQSFVGLSWKQPEYTSNVTGLGVLRLLEAIRKWNENIKFYQASSSEMFGKVQEIPQNENTKFYPRSPYGIAKLFGHWTTINYRESYSMFAVSGILMNHESQRRGIEFVTKKITDGVAKIFLGMSNDLRLGNLDAKRDWGYAPDYVEAMYLMLQQDKPEDYVISTGETHSVRDFVEEAFNYMNLNWREYVKQDTKFIRPAEVNLLIGDSTKARKKLGWEPKVKFKELIKIMVDYDIKKWQNKK